MALTTIKGHRRIGQAGHFGRTRGQSLVEFAVVLPVFLMIAFATLDFGVAIDTSLTVSNAAREGARLGTTQPSVAAIQGRVREVAGRLDDPNLTISVSCKTSGGAACPGGMAGATAGTSLVVRVGYPYRVMTPIAFGTTIPLSSTVEMRVE